MGRINLPNRTDTKGDIFLNGKTYTYNTLALYQAGLAKIVFLITKDHLEEISESLKGPIKFYWSSKKSPNGPLLSDELKWYKVIGQFETRIHENILSMSSFFELRILLSDRESKFCIIDEGDIRDAKLDSILNDSQKLPFI